MSDLDAADTAAPAANVLDIDVRPFRSAMGEADRVSRAFSRQLSDGFVRLTLQGRSLADVVSTIGQRLSRIALAEAFRPLEAGFADFTRSLLSGAGNGLASLFQGGHGGGQPMNLLPFAKGGVVAAPSYFPLAGGTGLMGERGAEAILPLARGPDGALGVRAEGGGRAVSVTVNIATPDVEGFRKAEAEVAAAIARAAARGGRAT